MKFVYTHTHTLTHIHTHIHSHIRVTSATLLDDRRDVVRAIKSLAKKYKAEVGSQCLPALVNVIRTDKTDIISTDSR